jgi:hypothetical protein
MARVLCGPEMHEGVDPLLVKGRTAALLPLRVRWRSVT